MKKNSKNNLLSLLGVSVFFHLLSCFCASYLDMKTQPNGRLSEVNYGLNFFSGGSVQASLLATIYFIYRLLKKSTTQTYFDKVFELVVINANIISIGIFTVAIMPLCGGGKPGTATPGKGGPITIFFFEMDRKVFWGIYAIIWHYLTPVLTITYFMRRKISLVKSYYERKGLFLYSFIHPLLYLIFVFCRPLIPGAENYPCGKSKYPYFFFQGIGGYEYSDLLWAFITFSIILFFLVIFWMSSLLFGRLASGREKKKQAEIEKKMI